VISVYRPAISAETWREQFQVTGDEAVVEGLTGRFDFSKFGQVLSGYRNCRDHMQAGYDEGRILRKPIPVR
jgi:hypothetical protein